MAGITPSQTVGPYFHYGLMPHDYDFSEVFGNNLVTPDASGERIRIEGRVIDGDGQGINDSLVEIWPNTGPLTMSVSTSIAMAISFPTFPLAYRTSWGNAPELGNTLE